MRKFLIFYDIPTSTIHNVSKEGGEWSYESLPKINLPKLHFEEGESNFIFFF